MILLIDNYDSFVFNLARYFQRLGQETRVVRNDNIAIEEITQLAPDAIVISPGPCAPDAAGCSVEVVAKLGVSFPILGICLGHQAIAQAYGGQVVRSGAPMHGRTSSINHDGSGIFDGVPNPLKASRYHSLVVQGDTLPAQLVANAWTDDGTIMAIQHVQRPVVGLQFHPESVLTDLGYSLLAAFLRQANISVRGEIPPMRTELKSVFLR